MLYIALKNAYETQLQLDKEFVVYINEDVAI